MKVKEEAKKRLRMLNVLPEVVNGIDDDVIFFSERVNKAFNAILYWATNKPELVEKIKEIETEYGVYVYHVQLSHTEIGDMWSMLYVGAEDEWELEREDLKGGCPVAYVWNESYGFGEFGFCDIDSYVNHVSSFGTVNNF